MLVINSSNLFCADYGALAACLTAIQVKEVSGDLDAFPEIQKQLRILQGSLLPKLYNRTLRVLGVIDGYSDITTGDFDSIDYARQDFFVGALDGDFEAVDDGDFEDSDYAGQDYYTGYLDPYGVGYSALFQTVLNVFAAFCQRNETMSEEYQAALIAVFLPVLDALDALKKEIQNAGFELCSPDVETVFNNSPDLYLYTAGSDGADGTAAGIHLRWGFNGELGRNHLPQGAYQATSNVGYHQANDYVQVYRIPYTEPVQVSLNFETAKPAVNTFLRQWTYLISLTINGKQSLTKIRLRFLSAEAYRQTALAINPQVNPFDFLKQYSSMIEVELIGKTAFALGLDFRRKNTSSPATLKAEIISVEAIADGGDEVAGIRKVITAPEQAAVTLIYGENMKRLHLLKEPGGYLQALMFETYSDWIASRLASDWVAVENGFALSLDDAEVFKRLEDTNRFAIDHSWPQYKHGTTVKVANYRDKWSALRAEEPSIKDTVQKYLILSETDPRAGEVVADTQPDGAFQSEFSYVDILNLLALDYHQARMLGLGYIDVPAGDIQQKYIYKIRYVNRLSLAQPETVVREFLSLPTGITDAHLPVKPQLRAITYSLPAADSPAAGQLDEKGYASSAGYRVVNIGRKPAGYEQTSDVFFSTAGAEGYNIYLQSLPVQFGIEYRPEAQSTYVLPEITGAAFSDAHPYSAYNDDYSPAGIPESVAVADHPDSLYVHFEQEEGRHFYAVYGINLFSRTSLMSDEVATDVTIFPPKNTLAPPTDVAVQYIQQEDTLIFTTATEQAWLQQRKAAFAGADVSYTRVTFNYLDITDISHLRNTSASELAKVARPDQIKVWFKEDEILQLSGLIANVIPNRVSGMALVYIKGYELLDGTSVVPSVTPIHYSHFRNSLLSTPTGQFVIRDLISAGNQLILSVELAKENEKVEDAENPGTIGVREVLQIPQTGARVTMVENLADTDNWRNLTQAITLVDCSNGSEPVIESDEDESGSAKYRIGGILASANIRPVSIAAGDAADMAGFYKVSFENGTSLPAHPQVNLPFHTDVAPANSPLTLQTPHVEWYKGLLRLPLQDGTGQSKLLEVVRIESLSPLTLYIYDPAYLEVPILQPGALESTFTKVNFHPGYKAYLYTEPEHVFNRDHIMPHEDEDTRKTFLALQTADRRTGGSGFTSRVSAPAILLARSVAEPVQPEMPTAFGLRVRPDATGKAAFTFDTKIRPDVQGKRRSPFGFMFYRTTHEDLLHGLYRPETVEAILSNLAALTEDPFFAQRYQELASLVMDPANPGHFKVYQALPAAYGFPVPDREGLSDTADNLNIKIERYRTAIRMTLMPLTEQPPMFSFIKSGPQTENQLPVIRDVDGNLLNPQDRRFNPFPMIRRYTLPEEANTTTIRFTDYSLTASSRLLYFYTSAEMTNQLAVGPMSPFLGPVAILHTQPAAAPVIQNYAIHMDDYTSQTPISVQFQLAPFASEEKIYKVRISRSLEATKTAVVSMMDSFLEVELNQQGATTGITVIDDFSGLPTLPLGETLYYRMAFVRQILNERDVFEDVLSEPSPVLTLTLVDPFNPEAPELHYEETEGMLTWMPTTNKGKYYLFKQSPKGNWTRMADPVVNVDNCLMSYTLSAPLAPFDEDGTRLYHRFKVKAENASGLFNLTDKELTWPV